MGKKTDRDVFIESLLVQYGMGSIASAHADGLPTLQDRLGDIYAAFVDELAMKDGFDVSMGIKSGILYVSNQEGNIYALRHPHADVSSAYVMNLHGEYRSSVNLPQEQQSQLRENALVNCYTDSMRRLTIQEFDKMFDGELLAVSADRLREEEYDTPSPTPAG